MKSIFITGSSSGIGKALALHFERKGYLVFAGIRNTADGDKLISEAGGKLNPVIVDVTNIDSIQKAVDTISTKTDATLDCLINNAGIAIGGALETALISQIQSLMDVNVVGLMAVTQRCLPLLRAAKGRIINIGSISGRFSPPGLSAYAASKFAVEGITDSLRVELKPFGIRVTVIEPGKIDTPIWEKALNFQQSSEIEANSSIAKLYQPLTKYYSEYAEKEQGLPIRVLVEATEHALASDTPKPRYLLGRASKIRVLLDKFPATFRDRIVKLAMGI